MIQQPLIERIATLEAELAAAKAQGSESGQEVNLLRIHEALAATMLAVNSLQKTIQNHVSAKPGQHEYDAMLVREAVLKVGELKRHNARHQPRETARE